MRSGPSLFGQPPAKVEMHIDGRQAVYLIDPGGAPRPPGLIGRALRWLAGHTRKSLTNQLVKQQDEPFS